MTQPTQNPCNHLYVERKNQPTECMNCGAEPTQDPKSDYFGLFDDPTPATKPQDFYGKGLIKEMHDRSVATKPLDELLDNLVCANHALIDDECVYCNGVAIKALIANAEKQARIDELKNAKNWCAGGQNCEYGKLADRIKELEQS